MNIALPVNVTCQRDSLPIAVRFDHVHPQFAFPLLQPLPSIPMVPFRFAPFHFRIQLVALSFVLSCFVAASSGCSPPREQAITTEDGEVATEFSDDMIDDGTPVSADQVEISDEQVTEK